jgi:hypothetical protein
MSRIVAGRFQDPADAEAALASLQREGFRSGEYESFYVSPPGENARLPAGGDQHSDRGTRKAGFGAAAGAGIGAAVGAAGGAVVSGEFGVVAILLGAGLGAYVGSFAGSMSKMRDGSSGAKSAGVEVIEKGGRMIAVNVDRPRHPAPAPRQGSRPHRRHLARRVLEGLRPPRPAQRRLREKGVRPLFLAGSPPRTPS